MPDFCVVTQDKLATAHTKWKVTASNKISVDVSLNTVLNKQTGQSNKNLQMNNTVAYNVYRGNTNSQLQQTYPALKFINYANYHIKV
jgi:hypothetical protein